MKTKFILSFLLSVAFVFGQTPITFQKTFSGTNHSNNYSVRQTNDGGYVTSGYIVNSTTGHDVLLIKTNANGDNIWIKNFGGANYEFGSSIQQTSDNGYVIAGVTTSFGAGLADIYIIKTDVNGTFQWSKTFGGINDEWHYPFIQQTADGGYIIACVTTSFGTGFFDAYLLKLDTSGNLLWSKTYGGTGDDRLYSVQQTLDGGYIITGCTDSFGAGVADVYLIKTDSNGNIIWDKTYGGSNAEVGATVRQTMSGGYIILGTTNSFASGYDDAFLIQTDSIGNIIWGKTYGGSLGDRGDVIVEQTTDGGFVFSGFTTSFGFGTDDAFIVKTDPMGNLLWSKAYGGTNQDRGNSVQQTLDGGYIMTGFKYNSAGTFFDAYLIKTDTNGNTDCNTMNSFFIQNNATFIQADPPSTTTIPSTLVYSPTSTMTTTPITKTTLCTNVGITEIEQNNLITIYPNPFITKANVELKCDITSNDWQFEMYDVLGKQIESFKVKNSEFQIERSGLKNGIYFICLRQNNQVIDRKKIIIID